MLINAQQVTFAENIHDSSGMLSGGTWEIFRFNVNVRHEIEKVFTALHWISQLDTTKGDHIYV